MGTTKVKKGNIITRFLGNKNTVTIICVLVCIATLVVGYYLRVKNAISPITVPYAKVAIPSGTKITADMIGRVKIAASYVSTTNGLITSAQDVVNKYSTYRTDIPEGSLFYNELVINADEMPDAAFGNIEDDYTIFSLKVDKDSTYGNSIRAGDYIDLYMKLVYDNQNVYAKFVESIRVLAVKDSAGNNILSNRLSSGTPSELLFSVKTDMYELLMESQLVGAGITIEPVIRNKNYTAAANETKISSEELRRIIEDEVEILSN